MHNGIKPSETRLVYKHNPAPISGDDTIWRNKDGQAFNTQVIPDTPEDLEAVKAEGWTAYPTVPAPKVEAPAYDSKDAGQEVTAVAKGKKKGADDSKDAG